MTVTMDYWSDPLCVWAYVAQPRLDRLIAEFGDALVITWRVVPVFGSIGHRLREGAWADGGVAGRVEATRRTVARYSASGPVVDGSVWSSDCPASSWGVGAAVEAVRLLEADGLAPAGATGQYMRAIRARFFEDNVNVARRREQVDLAAAQGLDLGAFAAHLDDGGALAALFEEHQERERLRIQGSPTYAFDGGRAMLYGNLSEAVLRATVAALIEDCPAGGSC